MDKTLRTRFYGKIDIRYGNDNCWEWRGTAKRKSYGVFWMNGKPYRAPRLMWELVNGPILGGLLVCHHCDNPSCCNPKHLFLGTHKDNMQDSLRKGRMACGEKLPQTRLTNKQVREIKGLLLTNITQRAIAGRFGIDPSTISRINSGERWKHVI